MRPSGSISVVRTDIFFARSRIAVICEMIGFATT